ncbi:MAG: hypothetical protein AB7O44_27575 [Hyphomicrobiaceae bacterium]
MRSIILAATLAAIAVPAQAQAIVCGKRADLLATLKRDHDEEPRTIGLAKDGGVLETTVSPSGSFSVLASYPRRPTCIIAIGEGWELLAAPQPGEPM